LRLRETNDKITSMVVTARAVAFVVATACCCAAPALAAADPSRDDVGLQALQEDVRADIAAGKPIVVEVHVPLCDNAVITCGGRGRGDGEDLQRNLYWSTSEGLAGWMGRSGSGWSLAARLDGAATGNPDILAVRVWQRALEVPRAWRRPGMPNRFTVYLVGFAWRGQAIDRALEAYLGDLYGDQVRPVTLAKGGLVAAGGAARIVGWVGHNRLMDTRADWGQLAKLNGSRRKGTLAVACYSASYLKPAVRAPNRVPLLMTASLVMASSVAFESGVMAFLGGSDLAAIRLAGATGYASGQRRPVERLLSAFTNPSDRRW
jgi:hypothetical protein